MSRNNAPHKAKRGTNGETRKRPDDIPPWELNEKKELIPSTVRGFFCAIPHYDENGGLEFCGADTEFINMEKLRAHIREHHVTRKKEAIKLAGEIECPENLPVKNKWTFLTPSNHPYKRPSHNRESSIAPSVGQSESRETSVTVDYSTWGFGDVDMIPMAIATNKQATTNTLAYPAPVSNPSGRRSGSSAPYPQLNSFNYGQAATNTVAFPAPGSIPGIPVNGNSTPYAQYNASALPAPPSYNPRSTPEQLQAQLTEAVAMLRERRKQSASLPPIDPGMNFIANVQASASFGLDFNPLISTFGPLAPQPILSFQNAQYAPFAHHGLRQGQIHQFLSRVEHNSPFRDPFPGKVFHPDGWVTSAMNRRGRLEWEWGRGLTTASMVASTSQGSTAVATSSHGQSGDEDVAHGPQGKEMVFENVGTDKDEEEQEYDPETTVVKGEDDRGEEEAGELKEGEMDERGIVEREIVGMEMQMDEERE